MVAIKRLTTQAEGFPARLEELLAREAVADDAVMRTVSDIIADVRRRGDSAVLDYTAKFDQLSVLGI